MSTCNHAIVQCSTGSLAPLGGGRYWNVAAMMEGVRLLGWPAIELRLWQEWDEGDMTTVAGRAKDAGLEINSVHIPPDSEVLLSTLGCLDAARDLMDKCLQAALAAGARVAVVHAWDLRRPQFSQGALVDNLNLFSQALAQHGVSLSVEGIPGHVSMLPVIARACPGVSFTVDTQWASLEDSWDLVNHLMPRVTNVHVQTYVDPIEGGGVAMGRTAAGRRFDAEKVIRGLTAGGYAGLVTLEPNGVPGVSEIHLRRALRNLEEWLQEIRPPREGSR